MAPDADGGDQLVDDGGVVTLLIQETTETEVFDQDETLPNHENSANPVNKYVLQWVEANRWTRKKDYKKNMMSNASDGDIGYFDNKIDMTGMKSSDDTKVDDIRPQVGHFVSLNILPQADLQHATSPIGTARRRTQAMETPDTMSTRSTSVLEGYESQQHRDSGGALRVFQLIPV